MVEEGNFDKAFSIFKREVIKSKVIEEVRKRSEYVKPSEIKRKNKIRAARRNEQQAKGELSRKSFTKKG
tara:strand:- start:221 stop:427 length:207 start_codon:yes stop_codon:yes gene_type:complete